MLTPPKSISKPNIRRHSSLEKLLVDHHHHHQHHSQSFEVPCFPSSPCRKSQSRIITCIVFLFFFFLTILFFLHSIHLDAPPMINKPTSPEPLTTKRDEFAQLSALKGLGTVFRRGTKAMNELVVAHVGENTSLQDFRLFLRTLHRSGTTARADVAFLFDLSSVRSSEILDVIHEENIYFTKLLSLLSNSIGESQDDSEVGNHTLSSLNPRSTGSILSVSASASESETTISNWPISNSSISPFNLHAFRKAGIESESASSMPLWGIHNANFTAGQLNPFETNVSESASSAMMLGWGSIIGFDASELNPDNALQGFIDQPPLALRRWACYQMLLGMVRHKFKHILLTDSNGVVILGDPISITRRKVGLYLSLEDRAWGVGDELGTKWGLLDADQSLNLESDESSTIAQPNQSDDLGKNTRRQLSTHKGGQLSGIKTEEDRSSHQTRPRRPPSDVHRRGGNGGSGGRRRRGKKSAPSGGLYEKVYGKTMWSSLEEGEKRKKLVNSGAIVGSIHQTRGLANTMTTEIVKVALERKSREPFPDSVLLSYLLHKSSTVLGKRVLDHLHMMDNGESFVHSLVASQQSSFFFKRTRSAYPMIHGGIKSRRWDDAALLIRKDICSSPAEASVYNDC